MSALDITNNGKLHWSIPTEPGALISSSIHRLELTNHGQWVRMIPSLSGSLYKFNGETLDRIPITAENLLSSSFKFSDDLVISGGKETQTYGVSIKTGQVIYKCSINGCINETDTNNRFGPSKSVEESNLLDDRHDPLMDDVLVVRRQTQTVRAVEPRSGSERWNFSVGHHEMEIIKSAGCHDRPFSDMDMAVLDMDIRVVVPEGIVCAFSKHDMKTLLWKFQFEHPIVSAWRNDESDNVQSIDLFDAAQWLRNGGMNGDGDNDAFVTPSVYLGMYRKQLYIQESHSLAMLVADEIKKLSRVFIGDELRLLQIPWKPYLASSSALAVVNPDNIIRGEDSNIAALSVLYASEYVNGHGFYLYSESNLNETIIALCDTTNQTQDLDANFDFTFGETDTPVKIIVISLWYWWKEIIVIALTTALVVNLVLTPKIRREREFVVIEKHIPVPTVNEATEDIFTASYLTRQSITESNITGSKNFVSRFFTDFVLIQRLGRGGFGVVFEAKNKLDDCKYAVKRIILPSRKESRERVLREVKTLANCEHQHIVRYFQAWVETPPPGWQEAEDKKWIVYNERLSTSIDIETQNGMTLPSFPTSSKSKGGIIDNRNKKLESWISSLNRVPEDSSDIDDSNSLNRAIYWKREDKSSFLKFRHNDKISCTFDHKEEISDSLEIEFEHSNISEHSEDAFENNFEVGTIGQHLPKTRNNDNLTSMKQHMSLDLTRQDDVIVSIAEHCQQRVFLYIQMQLCHKQSLKEWIRECRAESRHPQVKDVFVQIVDAVDYVHLKGLIHRDLKPSNIFFSLDGKIKIGDFGLVTDTYEPSTAARISDSPQANNTRRTQHVGTRLYMSPEQLEGRKYDFKVDIFSLGLILYELLVDFDTEMERVITLDKLRKGEFEDTFRERFTSEYNLLRTMLAKTPTERPSTSEIKRMLNGSNNESGDSSVVCFFKDTLIEMSSNLVPLGALGEGQKAAQTVVQQYL